MASRQTAAGAGLSGFTYAAPGTYANTAIDITLSNQAGNPKLAFLNAGGRGVANTASSQILPILPVNATPGNNGLSSSGTTGTVVLGNPHGLTIGSSGQTFTLSNAGLATYNCTSCTIASVPTSYSFTYTLAGGASNLATSGLGSVSLLGGSAAALTPFQGAVNGQTINGLVTGTLEIWGDNAIWDTANNRYLAPNQIGGDPANLQ